MRIISGDLKGKSFRFLKNKNTRPLKDSVKENIFNVLEHSNFIKVKIKDSYILDLYSGVGSFGLECLSRGAKKVTFIEKEDNAFRLLNENLIKLSCKNRAELYNGKIENFITDKLYKKYNIIFFDPPFKDDSFLFNLKQIKSNQNYFENHIIIIHREFSSKDNYNNLLKILITKKYGRSKLLFGKFF